MANREEIREGLFLWMGAYGIKEDDMVKAGIELFHFLHSQGVVIKKDDVVWNTTDGEAVAVEPLIKEEECQENTSNK